VSVCAGASIVSIIFQNKCEKKKQKQPAKKTLITAGRPSHTQVGKKKSFHLFSK
jgi:hypothetical protein